MPSDHDEVLIKHDDDPLNGQTAESILAKLRNALKGRVQEAYYFGSFMTDSFGRKSDIDLILVKETTTTFIERPLEFTFLHTIANAIDILVYTPDEFRKLVADPSPGFWRNVTAQMVQFL